MGLGLAQGAFELAMGYAQERKQFGKPIAKFQAISFKLADMATKIELARNLLYKACWLKDHKRPFAKEAAMSKLYCSEIAKEVADEAVQIHGGYGLMKAYDIERFYRDQRLLQIGEGTSEIQRMVIARHLGI
jgi:alkylation response protein AidB-like acyl-CoA dehydrogenase